MSPTTSRTPITKEVWPPPGWLTKKEAAERLNRSEPRVANMAQEEGVQETPAKPLKSRKMENPKTKQVVTLIHAGDVEAVLFQRDNPDKVIKVSDKPESPNNLQRAAPAAVATPPPEIHLHMANPPAPQRPWLTLNEAMAWSGLTKRWLKRQAEDVLCGGGISVLDMGKGTRGGRWRFLRDSLGKA